MQLHDGRGTDEDEAGFDEFRGLERERADVDPHTSVARQQENAENEQTDHDIDVFLFRANPFMIPREQKAALTCNKCGDAGNQVLEREMDTAEAGLENQAHAQYAQEHEIGGIGHLLIDACDEQIHKVKCNDTGSQEHQVGWFCVIAAHKDNAEHGEMREHEQCDCAEVGQSIFIHGAPPLEHRSFSVPQVSAV